MKKQYLRIKQKADQIIFKANKSEVFDTEVLQIAYQKTKYFKEALSAIVKALPPLKRNDNVNERIKNSLEYSLASVFLEHKKNEDDPSEIFNNILCECNLIEEYLVGEYTEHEEKLRDFVVGPILRTLETTVIHIEKQKRLVTNLILEQDATNNGSATRQISRSYNSISYKVEESRNALAYEMCNFLANEEEFAGYLLQIVKLQRGYHEGALKYLNEVIPLLEISINNWSLRKE